LRTEEDLRKPLDAPDYIRETSSAYRKENCCYVATKMQMEIWQFTPSVRVPHSSYCKLGRVFFLRPAEVTSKLEEKQVPLLKELDRYRHGNGILCRRNRLSPKNGEMC